jgi:hypothetical protein
MRFIGHLGAVSLCLVVACGLDAGGEVAGDLDAGSPTPSIDVGTSTHSSTDAARDAKHPVDATAGRDAVPDTASHAIDTGKDAVALDVVTLVDAKAHDGEVDAVLESSAPMDGSVGDVGTTPDSSSSDATGHDAAAHLDAAPDAGVDASPPPNVCIGGYGCGSQFCSCNQTCDDGTTCGACLPHFGTCPFDIGSCNTDFSSNTSCGACGNSCAFCGLLSGLAPCVLTAGVYKCGSC